MSKRDRQHYVSQAYLRNFSCDIEEYMKKKDKMSPKRKKNYHKRMRIFCCNSKNLAIERRKISKIASMDFYFPKEIDSEIQQVEQNLKLLRDIIQTKDETLLQSKKNKQKLWEIVNCFTSRSRAFREFIQTIQPEDIQSEIPKRFPTILKHFKENPDLIQASYFSTNPQKIIRTSWERYKKKYKIKEKPITDPAKRERDREALSILDDINMIPQDFYPKLVRNHTFLPFITGDDCVAIELVPHGGIPSYIPTFYFPINPQLALRFVRDDEGITSLKYEIKDSFDVYNLNRLLLDGSRFYLFAHEARALEISTMTL